MDDFKAIYRILKSLDAHKGDENFDYYEISAAALKMSFENWEQIMIELQRNDYIRGLVISQDLSQKFPHIVKSIRPAITLKGMEYLADNSMMAKAKELLQLAGIII